MMRAALTCLAVLSLACGRLDTPEGGALSGGQASATPGPTPSSPVAAAALPLIGGLGFQAYVPDGLPSDLAATASLVAIPGPARRSLGDPALRLEVAQAPGTKPWLWIIEGPDGCCPELTNAAPRDVTIRPAAGSAPAVFGRMYPAHGAEEGPSLRWRIVAGGASTEITMVATRFGPYVDETALLDLARTMRPLVGGTVTDAVRLYLSTHISHSPTGHRVYMGSRSQPLPDDARLLDASGATVATAKFTAPGSHGCLADAAGVAAFAVAHEVVDAFNASARGAAIGYRAEVMIGGKWRPAQLVASGCFSIE